MLLPALTALPPSPMMERKKRKQADEIIGYLGLGRYADTLLIELSTGTRRIVELSCLIALDAQLILLDEPTAGVAQKETEAFGPLITTIQKELGSSILIIEHDMPMVMSISDRIYCLEAGAVIAEGTPERGAQRPEVIASYLGTDERAIQRSGTRSTILPDRAEPQPWAARAGAATLSDPLQGDCAERATPTSTASSTRSPTPDPLATRSRDA